MTEEQYREEFVEIRKMANQLALKLTKLVGPGGQGGVIGVNYYEACRRLEDFTFRAMVVLENLAQRTDTGMEKAAEAAMKEGRVVTGDGK